MNGFGEKLTKSWDGNSTAAPSATAITEKEAAFKGFGSSMNALSFGFLATAILVSMFFIMAIFEHLLRSRAAHTSSQSGAQEPAMGIQQEPAQMQTKKMKSSLNVSLDVHAMLNSIHLHANEITVFSFRFASVI